MDKKNITAEETFTLAEQNQRENNLLVAENLYKETLNINPDHLEAHKKQKALIKKQSKLIPVMQTHIIILE